MYSKQVVCFICALQQLTATPILSWLMYLILILSFLLLLDSPMSLGNIVDIDACRGVVLGCRFLMLEDARRG
jgi:hypothetical protein